MADVGQSIAEREQVRADLDQERLNAAQDALDRDAPALAHRDFAGRVSSDQRQVELGRAQVRSDAHQTQLDDTQRAQDVFQNVLDEQQAPFEQALDANDPGGRAPSADKGELRDLAFRTRAESAVERAEQARRRAEEAARRAAEALDRAEAYERRRTDVNARGGPASP
jgi:hypothetical protein